MRVYKIEYREYEYRLSVSPYGRCDWALTNTSEKYVMADHALDGVDLLRSNVRHRIEIASIEYFCKVDIKK
jgi:hypothetical protein